MSKHQKSIRRQRRKTDAARHKRVRVRTTNHGPRITGAAALAAAAAIAVGSSAYADTVHFDNPPHGEAGHFHWAGEIGDRVWLNLTTEPGEQLPHPDGNSPSSVEQRVYGTVSLVNMTFPGGALQTGVGYPDFYRVVGVDSGELIPTPGTSWNGSAPTVYSFLWGGSLLPEGQATYLGVRFDLGAGNQYGWIGVVRSGVELEAFAWGYETEPALPIPAGAGGGTPCPADMDGDGAVNAADLAQLLGSWGSCDDACPADLDGDGDVDAADLAQLLGSWGDCD